MFSSYSHYSSAKSLEDTNSANNLTCEEDLTDNSNNSNNSPNAIHSNSLAHDSGDIENRGEEGEELSLARRVKVYQLNDRGQWDDK
jgi:hypothetical protein